MVGGDTGLADVTVAAGVYSGVTDFTGSFEITGVPAGTYEVVPSKKGYAFIPVSVEVTVEKDDVWAGTFGSVPLR